VRVVSAPAPVDLESLVKAAHEAVEGAGLAGGYCLWGESCWRGRL